MAVIGYWIIFPFWLAGMIISTLLRAVRLPDFGTGDATFHMLSMLGSAVHLGPVIALSIVKIFFPRLLDDLFFRTLRVVDPEHCKLLQQAPSAGFRKSIKKFFKRITRYLLYASLYAIASLFLGVFTRRVFKFILVAKLFGVAFAFLCAFFSFFPFTEPLVTALVEYRLYSRSMTREILDPYFRRVGHLRGYRYVEREFLQQNQFALFAFSVPFLMGMKVPFVGVLFWALAQCAIVLLLVDADAPLPGSKHRSMASSSSPSSVSGTQKMQQDGSTEEDNEEEQEDGGDDEGRGLKAGNNDGDVDSLAVNGVDLNTVALWVVGAVGVVVKVLVGWGIKAYAARHQHHHRRQGQGISKTR
eukprot:Nk52_evm1s2095 gene=Nk52_evmTU1s2095